MTRTRSRKLNDRLDSTWCATEVNITCKSFWCIVAIKSQSHDAMTTLQFVSASNATGFLPDNMVFAPNAVVKPGVQPDGTPMSSKPATWHGCGVLSVESRSPGVHVLLYTKQVMQ
jgi:hypothetical protein